MTPAWTGHALLRTLIYLYFAVGASLIANGVIFAIWLYFGGSANTYPPTFAWLAFLAILLALVATTRGQFGRPISLRKWIPLCLFASFGLLPLVLLFRRDEYDRLGPATIIRSSSPPSARVILLVGWPDCGAIDNGLLSAGRLRAFS